MFYYDILFLSLTILLIVITFIFIYKKLINSIKNFNIKVIIKF